MCLCGEISDMYLRDALERKVDDTVTRNWHLDDNCPCTVYAEPFIFRQRLTEIKASRE